MRSVINVIKGLGSWPQLSPVASNDSKGSLEIDGTKDIEQDVTSLDSNECDEQKHIPLSSCDELIVPKSKLQKVIIPEGYPPILERLALGRGYSSNITQITSDEKIDSNGTSSMTIAYEERLKSSESFRLIPCSKNALIDMISDMVGYKFVDGGLLEEALTHSSIMYKQSNQRLEFLGDAIIDFSIIDAIFRGEGLEGKWTQGDVTMRKIETSNNKNLSRIACKLRLYRLLNMDSSQLRINYEEIDNWYEAQLAAQRASYENLMNEKSDNGPIGCNPNEINDIELTAYINNMKTGVMKTLADTMEALIGAIFIDSQGNLETIKKCLMHIKLI